MATIWCRNGCNTEIHFDNARKSDTGRSIPLNEDGSAHDCPKSPYNQKELQGDSYRTPKTSSLSDFESKVLDKLDLLERKLDAVYSGRTFQDNTTEDEDAGGVM